MAQAIARGICMAAATSPFSVNCQSIGGQRYLANSRGEKSRFVVHLYSAWKVGYQPPLALSEYRQMHPARPIWQRAICEIL